MAAVLGGGAFVEGCGAEASLDPEGQSEGAVPRSDGRDDAAAPATTTTTTTSYPSGMVAAYSGQGVAFFSYDTATGFVPTGGLSPALQQMNLCEQLGFDMNRNLYLTCTGYGSGTVGRVLVFANGSQGESAPTRILTGPSLSGNLTGSAVDSKGNVYVAVESGESSSGAVVVFGPGSDSVPIRVIQGPDTQLLYPNNIAIDASDNVYVGTDTVPVVEFAPGADGDALPIQLIGGQAGCGGTEGVALDRAGRIYIDAALFSSPLNDAGFLPDSIVVFENGDIQRTISGSATRINELVSTAVDAAGRIFVGDFYGPNGDTGVYVYGAGASGDVAPEAVLTGVSGLAVAVAP